MFVCSLSLMAATASCMLNAWCQLLSHNALLLSQSAHILCLLLLTGHRSVEWLPRPPLCPHIIHHLHVSSMFLQLHALCATNTQLLFFLLVLLSHLFIIFLSCMLALFVLDFNTAAMSWNHICSFHSCVLVFKTGSPSVLLVVALQSKLSL